MPIPRPDPLDSYVASLAGMVAATSWLPDKRVVGSLGRAVFPTSRYRREHPRLTLIEEGGVAVGMYDDNTTPEWAIFWSHGLTGTRPKGWTIAHVWPSSDDRGSYTHLANPAMVREPLACLTDKDGPLTQFLRWHAWSVYQWKPDGRPAPTKPDGYEALVWRYLEPVVDPRSAIRHRLAAADNQRTRILRTLMENRPIP